MTEARSRPRNRSQVPNPGGGRWEAPGRATSHITVAGATLMWVHEEWVQICEYSHTGNDSFTIAGAKQFGRDR